MTKKRPAKKQKPSRKRLSVASDRSPFAQAMRKPVPLDVFRACVTVWQSAATFTLPSENPQERKFQIEGQTFGFADLPMNRGALAVKDFMTDQPDLMPAITCRIMAAGGQIRQLSNDPRFVKFFNTKHADGSIDVHECLLESFADADFVPRTLDVDLDSLLTLAESRWDPNE